MDIRKKRLYISSDIEGVAGVVSGEHLMPGGFEYQQAREWMTAEVAVACEAAFEWGIDEVVVSDSHGNGQNLVLDDLSDNVQVIRSWPRPLGMMEGIQNGKYDAAIFLGHHCGASDISGVLAHTFHGGAITEVRLNGQVASETVFNAAIAAHYRVPVIMVSGDDAYVEHAEHVLFEAPWSLQSATVEGVVSKWAASYTSARMLKPALVQQRIAETISVALDRLPEFQVVPISTPITLDVCCIQTKAVELLDYLPNVKRLDAHTLRFVGEDIIEVSKFLIFICFSGALTLK